MPPELSSPILLPPASPGYSLGSNSGIVAISAGHFIAPARAGLNAYSDPAAPGPAQVQDSQSAANQAAALDTIVIDLDTVGAVLNMRYLVFVTYLVIDGGSISPRLATVDHAGTVYVSDPGGFDGADGQRLFVSGGAYAVMVPTNSTNDAGIVLKTGAGQTVKFRAFHDSGAGSIVLDCVFLIPNTVPGGCGTISIWGEPGEDTWPDYTTVTDAYDASGNYGMFASMNFSGLEVDSDLAAAPAAGANGQIDVGGCGPVSGQNPPFRALAWVRCTDPAKGPGMVRVVHGAAFPGAPGATSYAVPADGSVYLMNLAADTFADTDYFTMQAWAPASGQHVRVGTTFFQGADPAPTGPTLRGHFRIT